jgi:predicted PurR-regulated permease PerM
VSLLMFETIFGFWGLFLSFPALYIAHRINHEFAAETTT